MKWDCCRRSISNFITKRPTSRPGQSIGFSRCWDAARFAVCGSTLRRSRACTAPLLLTRRKLWVIDLLGRGGTRSTGKACGRFPWKAVTRFVWRLTVWSLLRGALRPGVGRPADGQRRRVRNIDGRAGIGLSAGCPADLTATRVRPKSLRAGRTGETGMERQDFRNRLRRADPGRDPASRRVRFSLPTIAHRSQFAPTKFEMKQFSNLVVDLSDLNYSVRS